MAKREDEVKSEAMLPKEPSEKAGGLLDNLKGLDFSHVVTVVENIAVDAQQQDWFKLVADVGELGKVFGGLGQANPTTPTVFPVMSCGPDCGTKFDAACQSFATAKANCYSINIPPVKAGAGAQPGAAVGIDPSMILVALELAGKLVDMFKAWRANQG